MDNNNQNNNNKDIDKVGRQIKIRIIILLSILFAPMIISLAISLATGGFSFSGSNGSSKELTATCQVCKRTFNFENRKEDYRSVNRTNMCTNCYNNFKNAKK